ncbi:hypothetical protein [Niallia sp. RD1]|uniref:hypothetical protein n=1 Tax=Niallia sp. RD1 TaxID=2962858 RepID=UPI0020C18FA9|nr:hypothetical protein [Niallia sp. RD1]UTI41110.1 hypothetical protein NKG37_19945 [Niallia sp. RD1]
MARELEKTEFEKAVELLSFYFNVDEFEAKKLVEDAFAKAENAGDERACCGYVNIEVLTINISSEGDISSIAKELNQLVVMKNRKGGMGA